MNNEFWEKPDRSLKISRIRIEEAIISIGSDLNDSILELRRLKAAEDHIMRNKFKKKKGDV